MDTRSKILLSIMLALVVGSAFVTYYRYVVLQDFEVIESEEVTFGVLGEYV